jgi:1,4-dihydroxy-2-naphthoate polyprenyltransferase
MNVLIIMGHPRHDSLCAAMAAAVELGAREAEVDVCRLDLGELKFDPNVRTSIHERQIMEPDLQRAQALIRAADHLVIVYPTWWGTTPALVKGFLDRVLAPGFAFTEKEEGRGWNKLLTGKSAHLITTMDTPWWVYRWIYRQPGFNAMSRATLQFCGVSPVRHTHFGPVRSSTVAEREAWLAQARHTGARLAKGARTIPERAGVKIRAWLAALRLQFYPMTFLAYAAGSAGAMWFGAAWSAGTFWLGYTILFCVEAAAVLANEIYDYRSDVINRNAGPFTGGSRVLVEKRLSTRELGRGTAVALFVAVIATVLLVLKSGFAVLLVLGPLSLLALGYTVPPLKLCHRGLGEVTVAATHSAGVILCGYVIQGGLVTHAFPWLLSLPLFLAVLAAIILAGIPDLPADRDAGKRTLSVRIGARPAALAAMLAAVTAAVVAVVMEHWGWLPGLYQGAPFLILPHVVLLCTVLVGLWKTKPPARIDLPIGCALSYLIWFAAFPLYHLLHQDSAGASLLAVSAETALEVAPGGEDGR